MKKFATKNSIRVEVGYKFKENELNKITFHSKTENGESLVVCYLHKSFFEKYPNSELIKFKNNNFNLVDDSFIYSINNEAAFVYLCNPNNTELAFNVYDVNKNLIFSENKTFGCTDEYFSETKDTEIVLD